MDDLIVIILTLIIVVVGAIGQIKKKNVPPPKTDTPKTPDFWSLITGDDNIFQNGQNAEIIEPATHIEKEVIQPSYKFDAENEGRTNFAKEPFLKEEKVLDKKEKSNKKIAKTFSLKKAVIYSEILNRKYS